LYPGHGGPFLQDRQRLGDGLPVSGGHHLGHRIGGEGPQQRDALGCLCRVRDYAEEMTLRSL
jgi:hypothetical protein